MHDYSQAEAFINALTFGNAHSAVIDWRAIHDQDKATAAIPFRDTLTNAWSSIVHYNNLGYGIFATIAEMDGNGRELHNVAAIRAHYIDLDNISAQQNFERASNWFPAPAFAVSSSAGKFHVYWPVHPYRNNDRFSLIQRKLRQFFDGDRYVIDAARVMRVPGTYHLKGEPSLVKCFALAGYAAGPIDPALLEIALANVNITDAGGVRHDLGEPSLAAPSLDWLKFGLALIDPNDLDRGEWISLTAAIKQAGFTHGEAATFQIWSDWCARYHANDIGENNKQWNSIRQTEIGWPSIERRAPGLIAYRKLGGGDLPPMPPKLPSPHPVPPMPSPAPAPGDDMGELLNHIEQEQYFAGCFLIENTGEILTPSGRYMNATKFNAAYGGKKFIIDSTGKVTNEPWQAATRSTLWTVPKVDHIRFLPSRAPGEIVENDLGRRGINVYRPATIRTREGDPSPFLRHIEAILPDANDRKILLDYIAHNVRFPGYKIPWSPVIQSTEGVGKGVLKLVLEYAIGESYTYFPNAKEMVESGSKFNAWMRHKLFILADEIKVDERRDMIEVLKPMISEERIEVQGKGKDQDKEDNFANWAFFTNYKDAIPINKNGRRFAIFFSPLQSVDDLNRLGMDQAYFDGLYGWLKYGGGFEIVAHYLKNYPIEFASIPMRAPTTTSTVEAIKQSRGPIEQLIFDSIEDQQPGFRGGWVSIAAVVNRMRQTGVRAANPKTIAAILEALQFFPIGRSLRPYFAEDANNRSMLYNIDRSANVADFGRWQGYE